MKNDKNTNEIMSQRFGCDKIIALATHCGSNIDVRNVNAYYENGSFYIITHALSNKMQQIAINSNVALCGEWFSAHGIGENLGYILKSENLEMLSKLKITFSTWYNNGHINESDFNTVLLRIKLTDGVLFSQGSRYDIDFT